MVNTYIPHWNAPPRYIGVVLVISLLSSVEMEIIVFTYPLSINGRLVEFSIDFTIEFAVFQSNKNWILLIYQLPDYRQQRDFNWYITCVL